MTWVCLMMFRLLAPHPGEGMYGHGTSSALCLSWLLLVPSRGAENLCVLISGCEGSWVM